MNLTIVVLLNLDVASVAIHLVMSYGIGAMDRDWDGIIMHGAGIPYVGTT